MECAQYIDNYASYLNAAAALLKSEIVAVKMFQK